MSHCSLAVGRGARYKYVQFAAAADVMPPLLFDLSGDPGQVDNLLSAGVNADGAAWEAAQELLQWHMRSVERTLSGSLLDPERGLVDARDDWR